MTLGQTDGLVAGGGLAGRLGIGVGMDLGVNATSHILFFYTVADELNKLKKCIIKT